MKKLSMKKSHLLILESNYSKQNCLFRLKPQFIHHRKIAIFTLTQLTILSYQITSFASILDNLSYLIWSTYESETLALPTKLYSLSTNRPHTYEHCSTTLSVAFFNFYSSWSYLKPFEKDALFFQGKGAPQIPKGLSWSIN